MATQVPVGPGSGGNGNSTVTITMTFNGANSSYSSQIGSTNANATFSQQTVNLSNGFNSITVPTTAGMMVIIPPNNNTASMILKGVTGDTGIELNTTAPLTIPFPSTPPASVGITAGSAISGVQVIFL